MSIPTEKTVATPSAAVLRMQQNWDLCAALLGGTSTMRQAREKYLPKWKQEEGEAYENRLKRAVLFPAYRRTVGTLSGKPFSRPVKVEGFSEEAEKWLEDVDMQGRDFGAFASDHFRSTVGYGLGGILAEYPTVDNPTTVTKAFEKANNIRPYLVSICAHQLLGWIMTKVNNQWVFKQIRYKEYVTVDDGPYHEAEVEQVRVINQNTWEVHRKDEKDRWQLFEKGINTLGEVPFVPTYGDRTDFMESLPPLLDVAYLNVAHWQSASDQQTILHVARVPILAVTGIDDVSSIKVGASSATKLPSGADMKYVEHTGAAIEAGAKDLDSLEDRMRQAGAELLVLTPGRISATQIHNESSIGTCALQQITENYENALSRSLGLMAKWAKTSDTPKVTLFKEFGVAGLAEASAQLLIDMADSDRLSDETLHSEFQRRGILSPDTSYESEKARMKTQISEKGSMLEKKAVAAARIPTEPRAPIPNNP